MQMTKYWDAVAQFLIIQEKNYEISVLILTNANVGAPEVFSQKIHKFS